MTGTLQITDGALAVERTGSGTPTIVFLHGFSLDRRSWRDQMEGFAHRATCISYDLRGFGQSTLPTDDYDHTDDLKGVLDGLGIDRAVLVGLSLGANIALSFAAHHPDRVSGLVLASSGLFGHDWGDAERPPAAIDRIAANEGAEAARKAWLAHALFASTLEIPAARDALLDMVGGYSGWHWQAPGRGARIAPVGPLGQVATPTLVLSGDRDVGGYRDIAGVLARELPKAELLRLAGVGHMMNLEDPARFDAALTGFLDRLDHGQEDV